MAPCACLTCGSSNTRCPSPPAFSLPIFHPSKLQPRFQVDSAALTSWLCARGLAAPRQTQWIIYESQPAVPLLRLCWNKQTTHNLACISMDSSKVVILDIRRPSQPVATLEGHRAGVNSIAWAPHSPCHICTAGDDRQALIWDLQEMPKPIDDPILAYQAESGAWCRRNRNRSRRAARSAPVLWCPCVLVSLPCRCLLCALFAPMVVALRLLLSVGVTTEINQLQWSTIHHDWVSIAFGNKMQILRV